MSAINRLLFLLLGSLPAIARAEDFQGAAHKLDYEAAPIRYYDQTPADPVAQLQHRLATGETKLPFDEEFGYLPALLKELKISPASQLLVFSKTSLQGRYITPQNPRALYYNDDVYIGYVPGAPALEISAVDPNLGGVFYRMENQQVRRPRFVRDQDCLQCHGATRTLGVPGHLVRSIGTDASGELLSGTEVADVDQCTPLADRWGGYYVTGQHGGQTHRGNMVGAEAKPLGNLTDLARFIDPEKYPQPGSDLVALMVLEHQAKMHNYITRLHYETQSMLAMYGHTRYLKSQINAFLRYLLFAEEAPLAEPVSGRADFTQAFAAQGPRDAQGRSLRDFDLHTRLFKYPCSFLIYSAAFDALPSPMRDEVLQRLQAILTGEDQDSQFARLDKASRRAILEILRETKPNLPAGW